MPTESSFDSFQKELTRLVGAFRENLSHFKSGDYGEAALRNDFLNPLWRALGWDLENRAGLPQPLREVELETRVDIRGRKKRADYIFRTGGIDRFVCEAKKPKEELTSKYAYQVQRYAFNLKVLPALLSDFEELHVFIVGGKPDREAPWDTLFRWHFLEYPDRAQQIWDLFARENVTAGALDRFVAGLPKKAVKGKARQGWLIPRKRQRMVDAEFLTYIEEQREELARDLVRENKKYPWDDPSLNEAIQRILDRILFIRICEDRDIDTIRPLERIVDDWRRIATARQPLYPRLVGHFRSLDKRFNGALFRRGHESEEIKVSDDFLVNLIGDLSSEDSPYLFSTLPVEILGSVYERFIGKVVHVTKGGKLKIGPKPEARKAGGIYYTPRYIVDYIVDQTVGKLLEGKSPKKVTKLKILDPACGSGSFLLRAFERICEHYLRWYFEDPKRQRDEFCYKDTQGNLHLTTHLKRQIMLENIFGVDLDPQAVEVTMLSLYLKILEGETRASLAYQQRLFPKETFLPDLSKNIRLGNSLIENDYFDLFADGQERARIKSFDWKVEFREIMSSGGFDFIIGNPPYVRPHKISLEEKKYFWKHYKSFRQKADLYCCFIERALDLVKERGLASYIVSKTWMALESFATLRRLILDSVRIHSLILPPPKVFQDATVETVVFVFERVSNAAERDEAKVTCATLNSDSRLEKVTEVPQQLFRTTHLSTFTLSLAAESQPLKEKLLRGTLPLEQCVDFFYGLKTGDDSVFLSHKRKSSKYKKVLRRSDFIRYACEWKGEYVWYVPERMRAHRKTARPGDRHRFEVPKIMVLDIAKGKIVATLDTKKYYVKDALLFLEKKGRLDLRYVLGLLNSKLLKFCYS